MNVVDSSGWLEYFSDGPNADFFAPPIESIEKLIVPSISIFEVFKRILQQRDESAALQAITMMRQGQVADLNLSLALRAGKISHEHKLPLADSVILATARIYNAILWTQDADFEDFEGVKFVPRSKK